MKLTIQLKYIEMKFIDTFYRLNFLFRMA